MRHGLEAGAWHGLEAWACEWTGLEAWACGMGKRGMAGLEAWEGEMARAKQWEKVR